MPGEPGEPGSSNLGTDLSGHHPVSIEVNTLLINDKDAQCNAAAVTWRVCFPQVGQPVQLRPTNNEYGAGMHTRKGVQCTSCHDAHEDTPRATNFSGSTQPTLSFRRILSAFLATGIAIWRASDEFDERTEGLVIMLSDRQRPDGIPPHI